MKVQVEFTDRCDRHTNEYEVSAEDALESIMWNMKMCEQHPTEYASNVIEYDDEWIVEFDSGDSMERFSFRRPASATRAS